MAARILTLDIETSPNLADVWGLYDQSVSLNQLRESTRVICFAAKWLDERKTMFFSEYQNDLVSVAHDVMILNAWELLDEADVVVHYNGTSFDIKHLNREFAEAGLTPPSPFFQVDLLRAVKANFRFPSNKLQYVSTALGLKGKTPHTGHQLWVDCLNGDEKAWKLMEKYNRNDVILTEKVYLKLRPWIKNHPNVSLFSLEAGCPNCGSTDTQKRGIAYTGVNAYQQHQCKSCGRWFRSARALPDHGTSLRGIA